MNIDQTTRTLNDPPHADMIWIPGGTFSMGSENFCSEERPVHEVAVDGFWMDRYEVTIEQYARFLAATGYLTLTERPLNPAEYPGAPPENLVQAPCSFVKRARQLIYAITRTGGRGCRERRIVAFLQR